MTDRPDAGRVLAAAFTAGVQQLARRSFSSLRCRRRHLLAFTVKTPDGLLLVWSDWVTRTAMRRTNPQWSDPSAGWRAEWYDQSGRWTALVVGCSCIGEFTLDAGDLHRLATQEAVITAGQ